MIKVIVFGVIRVLDRVQKVYYHAVIIILYLYLKSNSYLYLINR